METCNRNSFRQVCDKPCANRVVQAKWSPLRDLIAIITSNGDIRLHRLYWQKVWVIPSKESHAICLCWKGDGKILSVGYENGNVCLYEIEKASVVHMINCGSKVTCLNWSTQKKEDFSVVYKNNSKVFFPDIDKDDLQKNMNCIKQLLSDDEHSILTVGTTDGGLFIFVDGIFLCVKIPLEKFGSLHEKASVVSTHLMLSSGRLAIILNGAITSGDNSRSYFYLHQFHSELLGSHGAELSHLSLKFTKIASLLKLCEKVLKQMADASEDIFVKINSKLEKLEELVSGTGSSVAAEFTIAYAAGITSAELQTFLTQHLTTKGLKQIAHSVQTAYSSLHNDVKDELELLTQHLVLLFVELSGMAKWFEKFGVLGLSFDAVQECLVLLAQFIMKSHEFLAVIADDMNNFKVFFNWLANLVFDVSGEQRQNIFNPVSNNDYDVMLEFLENRLLKIEINGEKGYDLERVSQFFKEGDLSMPRNEKPNDWQNFLNSCENFQSTGLTIKPDRKATLKELFSKFNSGAKDLFNSVANMMSDSVSLSASYNLFQQAEDHQEECVSLFSFHNTDSEMLLSAIPCSCDSDSMFMFRVKEESAGIKAIRLAVGANSNESNNSSFDFDKYQYTLRDMKFYNQEIITLLFEEEDTKEEQIATIFGQINLKTVLDESYLALVPSSDTNIGLLDQHTEIPALNLSSLFTEQRKMESFRGRYLSVNGFSREVTCIVSLSGRRVRVFDMTAEDDEQDESKIDDDSKIEDSSKADISNVSAI